MNRRLDPASAPWMSAPETRRVMGALSKDGGTARFVGGVVRNALAGRPISDIDIATPLPPDEVTRRLEAAGLGGGAGCGADRNRARHDPRDSLRQAVRDHHLAARCFHRR